MQRQVAAVQTTQKTNDVPEAGASDTAMDIPVVHQVPNNERGQQTVVQQPQSNQRQQLARKAVQKREEERKEGKNGKEEAKEKRREGSKEKRFEEGRVGK